MTAAYVCGLALPTAEKCPSNRKSGGVLASEASSGDGGGSAVGGSGGTTEMKRA
jgi:hypothetical protein